MRKRHVDEQNDADTEPDDQIPLGGTGESSPPSVTGSVETKNKTNVTPLDPEILKPRSKAIVSTKRPLQQTDNLPSNGVHKTTLLPGML